MFWGYFPAYDWVAFCWLFGGMNDLPFAFPQLCLDIKQWAIELGDPELPRQVGARHHALADARWTKDAWAFLAGIHPTAGERRSLATNIPISSRRRRREPHFLWEFFGKPRRYGHNSSSGVSSTIVSGPGVMTSPTLRPCVRTYSVAKRPWPRKNSSQLGL